MTTSVGSGTRGSSAERFFAATVGTGEGENLRHLTTAFAARDLRAAGDMGVVEEG